MSPEWIFGRNAVREALLTSAPLTRVLIARGAHGGPIDEVRKLARERNVPVRDVDRSDLDQRARNHQGVMAELRSVQTLALGALLERLKPPGQEDLVLALDSVQDPGNVGALIRTAAAVGVRAVVLPEHRAAGVTPTVVKASAGTALRVPIAQVPNLRQALSAMKELGYWVIGLEGHANESFDRANLSGPLVIVVGAEGRGLGDLVRRECDLLVRLPISSAVESLNASVAGSILMYHLYRSRENQGA